jgi:MFS transporter, DHA2 family, multidrug resistance protein
MSNADVAGSLSPAQRYVILALVVLASTGFTATILVATALLPQMQGALSATQDEISWVMTFNIVATAVATPMTGWTVTRFGHKAVMIWSTGGFAAATVMCGASDSLDALVFWRIVQGALGAPIIPLGQTLLLDVFPRRQHSMVISIFGMANMIGPVVGPTFGGQIAEAFGWRWGFYMVVPVCVIAFIGFRFALPPDHRRGTARLDWIGFIGLSIAIGAMQLVFSRGQRLDWYESVEIIIATALAAVAFYIFLAHSLTVRQPFLNLNLLRDRNYALGLVMVTLYGMLNFAPMVILPPLLQQHMGFPDSLIGEIVGYRGLGAAIGFFIAMFIERIDPRVSMVAGSLLQVFSGYWMMTLDLSMTPSVLMANSFIQGVSVGVVWVPLTVIAFSTLPVEHRAESMAVFHLLRNLGSSLFISISVAEIVRATGSNYARLAEFISPYNKVVAMPWATGSWAFDSAEGLARISREIGRQSIMIGYTNAFLMYTLISFTIIPLCLLARRARPQPA